MAHSAFALASVVPLAVAAGTGPVFAPGENNVLGAMPSPAGNPPAIVLVGAVSSALECERAAYANSAAVSWTWHHCDFPVSGSGNYSCHCYARTDVAWAPRNQSRVDSGHLGRILRHQPSPPTPAPPGPLLRCASELDCGLNGVCNTTSGQCACDAPWMGSTCSVLDLLPVQPNTGYHAFDADGKPTSSWGGSVVSDDRGGYFMFSSEMLGHCGIGAWTFNSRVILAKSRSAVGPYTFVRELLPAFAHEVRFCVFFNVPFHANPANKLWLRNHFALIYY